MTMSSLPPDGDGFLEGVYQEVQPVLPTELKQSFKPWHKPRKHHIRVEMWCAAIGRLLRDNGLSEGDVLTYLGMPGEDFLDLRTLKNVCEPAKIKIRYLGIDSSAGLEEFETNLSNHEISHLNYIYEHSYLMKGRIEDLANTNSTVSRRAASFRSFDIINIDLCDSIASVAKKPYFDALYQLCLLQQSNRTKPWLLFLATRIGHTYVDADIKQKLVNCVLRNLDEHTTFDSLLRSTLSLGREVISEYLDNKQLLPQTTLVQLFVLAISKWLLRMMLSGNPEIIVSLMTSYSYRVYESQHPDMVSLGFLFEPHIKPPSDTGGIVKNPAKPPPPISESTLAENIVKSVGSLVDVDVFLNDNPQIFHLTTQEAAGLLATARYDPQSFLTWVNEITWKPATDS